MSLSPEPTASPPWFQRPYLPFLVLALLSLAHLAGSWDGGFTARDDDSYCVHHPVVRGEEPLIHAFTQNRLDMYMPVMLVSFRIDYLLFSGWNPQEWSSWACGARFTNWAYHALAGFILWFWILPSFAGRGLTRFLVTAAFLLHPCQSENVAWIAERKAVLSGLFAFASWAAYLKLAGKTGTSYALQLALTALLFALSLGSKISSILMAGVFLAGEWLVLQPPGTLSKNIKRSALQMCVLVLVSLPIFLATLHSGQHMLGVRLGDSIFQILGADAAIMLRYWFLLLWPLDTSPYYLVTPAAPLFSPTVLLSLFASIGILAATWFLVPIGPERRKLAFAWLWFFLALALYLNFASQPEFMHDRYLYLSIPAFFWMLALIFQGAMQRWGNPAVWEKSGLLATFACCLLWTLTAVTAGMPYRSEIETFTRAAEKQPGSSFSQGYLALSLARAADQSEQEHKNLDAIPKWRREAIERLERAVHCADINLDLRRVQYYLARASVLKVMGEPERAKQILREVVTRASDGGWNREADRVHLEIAVKWLNEWP